MWEFFDQSVVVAEHDVQENMSLIPMLDDAFPPSVTLPFPIYDLTMVVF